MPFCSDIYITNEKYFEKLKRERIHPDTSTPLRNADKTHSPWLFLAENTTKPKEGRPMKKEAHVLSRDVPSAPYM